MTTTTRNRYTREDVTRSYHQGHHGDPMVNVKVTTWPLLQRGMATFRDEENVNPHFTEEWIESHVSEESLDATFWSVCEWRWEDLQAEAERLFVPEYASKPSEWVKVYSAGRSGGWCVVTGLGDVDEWDAVQLAKWRSFEKYARATVEHIPSEIVENIYFNEFEQWVTA